jgi:hypothetical protein
MRELVAKAAKAERDVGSRMPLMVLLAPTKQGGAGRGQTPSPRYPNESTLWYGAAI